MQQISKDDATSITHLQQCLKNATRAGPRNNNAAMPKLLCDVNQEDQCNIEGKMQQVVEQSLQYGG